MQPRSIDSPHRGGAASRRGPAEPVISPDAWRAAGATLAWRGLRVFYRDAATDRPPLLLLHGFPTSSWDFAAVWDALAARYRPIAFDCVGFGFSSKPAAGPYAIFAYADQAEAVLAACGVDRCDVLAHDLGVTVAQELLARDRDAGTRRYASIAFLNGGLLPELHRPRLGQRLLASPAGAAVARLAGRAAFERGLAEVFGPRTKPSRQDLDGYWQCAAAEHGTRNFHRIIGYMSERRLYRDRWVGAVLAPRVPTCVVNGHHDPVSGKHLVDRLHTLAAPLRIVDLPDVGHYPQCEAPDDVVAAYLAFRASVQ